MTHDAAVPSDAPEPKPLSRLLAEALDEAGISNSELARRLADASGTKPASKRRLVQKYLRGETTDLTRQSARDLADALGRPPSYFLNITPRPTHKDLVEQVAEIAAQVERLRRLVESRNPGEDPPRAAGAST